MANQSPAASPLLGQVISEKLNKTNYGLWKAQLLPVLRGVQLDGYLDGTNPSPPREVDGKIDGKGAKVPNPDYTKWYTTEQQVLGFLLTSLSRDVLAQVSTLTSVRKVWATLEATYASQSRARTVNTRIALATTHKGNMSVVEYMNKMKSLADELAAAGKPIEDEELVSYVLAGLDAEFNPVVSALVARVEPVSIGELYSQLLSFEHGQDLLHGGSSSSANVARRGRGGNTRGGRGDRGRGSGAGRGRGTQGGQGPSHGTRNSGNRGNSKNPRCQVCDRVGHTAFDCWYRFDEDYVPQTKSAAAATHGGYGTDPYWHTDTGATDHITGELEKLSAKKRYNGNDKVHTASGAGSGNEENSSGR